MAEQYLIPQLFRTEYKKIVAVLCRYFGIHRIDWAEDIASDTFLEAAQSWPFQGLPANPQAWLYAVAKNKAINAARREQNFQQRIRPDLTRQSISTEPDLSDMHIRDSQLQMMFVLSDPSIPPGSQAALALRLLCGFGISEIANAYLTKKETIEKRLYRAKEKLREEGLRIEWPAQHELGNRLDSVLTMIYLLFNEGYYSQTDDRILREDLCFEAIYLVRLLLNYPPTSRPQTKALLALMCFHASRFKARRTAAQPHVLYQQQDESVWDQSFIAEGAQLLHEAAEGDDLSVYHLEAAIAWSQTKKDRTTREWQQLVHLYDLLLERKSSDIARLDRLYALSKFKPKKEVIQALLKLNLTENPFYFALLADLYTDYDNREAIRSLEAAIEKSATRSDKQALQTKLDILLSLVLSPDK